MCKSSEVQKNYNNNIVGTEKLFKACKDTSVENIIYSSSAGVYKTLKAQSKKIVN